MQNRTVPIYVYKYKTWRERESVGRKLYVTLEFNFYCQREVVSVACKPSLVDRDKGTKQQEGNE